MKIKYSYLLIAYLLTYCLQGQSQVYVNVCVTQSAPLLLSHGAINNENCLNSFNGSATVNASGGKIPYSYSWNTSPAQFTQTASGLEAGIYTATVVDADSCMNTISFVITRNPDPIASFSNTIVCNTNATQFTDSSTTPSGTISTWSWDFGNGSPFNAAPSPSYTYTNGGNYNVTLIVNNSFGCADTISKPVQVYYNPVAVFAANNICFGDTMYFSNTSSVDNSTSIASYLWAFDDASPTSNLQNPTHYYSGAGTYSVTLVATTIDGCSNAAIIPVNSFDAPTTAFMFSNTCLFDSALFTNTSVNPIMGSTASWSWNFGDGSPLNTTAWSPGHLYAVPGNYQLTLITHSSNLGCPDTLKDSITVFPMPVSNFGLINVCLNQATNFNDLSSVSGGSIAGILWNFGDATPLSTIQNPNHTYANPGTYTVSLISTTNNGCKDTMTKSVVVHPLPTVQFSTVNVCDGNTIPFTDLSNIPATDTLQSWTWNFGDGSAFSTSQNTSHLYAAQGSYTVQVLVVSNFGCSNSTTKTVIVNPNPIVNFIANDTVGCEPLCVSFQNLSSITTGNNAAWLWSFGNGSTANNSENPNRCFTNDSVYSPNFFNVTLTVTSDSGCISALSKNNYITAYPNPEANFTVQPTTTTITDPVISITDLSIGANFWNWNFGGGSAPLNTILGAPSPYTYPDTGTYTITLITSTQYNCIDTAYNTVIIEPDFLFYIPNAFTPDDDGVNDNFSGKGIFIKEYEMMIFDRWGNLIYKTTDINQPWDGKANKGSYIAQADVYVYVINVTDFKNEKHNYKGLVTLVK